MTRNPRPIPDPVATPSFENGILISNVSSLSPSSRSDGLGPVSQSAFHVQVE